MYIYIYSVAFIYMYICMPYSSEYSTCKIVKARGGGKGRHAHDHPAREGAHNKSSMAHVRQSRPDSGLGVKVEDLV